MYLLFLWRWFWGGQYPLQGVGPEIETFLCAEMTTSAARAIWAQMALAGYPLDAISQGPKTSRFPVPNPLPLAQVIDAARIKSITHRAV